MILQNFQNIQTKPLMSLPTPSPPPLDAPSCLPPIFYHYKVTFDINLCHNFIFKVGLIFPDSHYQHEFDSIGFAIFTDVIKCYEDSLDFFIDEKEIIKAQLFLRIVGGPESQVTFAAIKFDNGYLHSFGPAPNHFSQLNIFQNAIIGRENYNPDEEDNFYLINDQSYRYQIL